MKYKSKERKDLKCGVCDKMINNDNDAITFDSLRCFISHMEENMNYNEKVISKLKTIKKIDSKTKKQFTICKSCLTSLTKPTLLSKTTFTFQESKEISNISKSILYLNSITQKLFFHLSQVIELTQKGSNVHFSLRDIATLINLNYFGLMFMNNEYLSIYQSITETVQLVSSDLKEQFILLQKENLSYLAQIRILFNYYNYIMQCFLCCTDLRQYI